MPTDSERNPLPFEPTNKRKKATKDKETEAASKVAAKSSPQSSTARAAAKPAREVSKPVKEVSKPAKYRREDVAIPEEVSRRMLRRMVYFSGIPVSMGVLVFFASYVAITQGIAEIPNVVVLLITLACFGLSVVGLSYGALSASWDEGAPGSLIGFEHFGVNFGRLVGSWRQAREERRNNS